MSTAQFKKRTTRLDIPGKVCDLYQHVVKTCPSCKSTKPRPDRSRVSGLRAEEFGDLHLFGSWMNTKLETKPLDFWLFWMVLLHTWQHNHVRVPLRQKSFPNFMNGWALSRWTRRRFVQMRLSIILMTCRHSIECIMWSDSYWTTYSLAKSSWDGCTIVQGVSLGIRGYSLQNFGSDHSATDHTCPVDAQGSDGEKHTGNSEWQNACWVGHRMETKRSHGPSFHGSRTADIHIKQTGPAQCVRW